MENIYFVLIMVTLLCVSLICNQKTQDIEEQFIIPSCVLRTHGRNASGDFVTRSIQNVSSTTDRLDPKDYLLYLPENELHNPIIPAAKNVTNDRKDDAYVTFDSSHSVNPKYRFHPENKHQVTFLLNKKKFGTDVRVSGGNNTFNDISITKDTMIRTDRFNQILNINQSKKQVTVESGVLLEDLNKALFSTGMSLPVLPECMKHSVGGAVSTSVHGTCINRGSLSSYIIDITMVLPTGKIKTFTKKDKEFKALTTGLGCLGLIYSVTLQCVDPFTIRHEEILSNWDELSQNLKTYLDSNNLLQIYLIDPYDPKLPCVVFLRKKMDIKSTEEVEVTQDYNRNLRIGHAHQILGNDIQGKFTEQEIGVGLKDLNDAVQNVVTFVRGYKKEFDLVSKYPIIIRFSGKDKNSYLSSSKRKTTAWISIYNESEDVKKDCLDKMTNEIEDRLILKYKGRPNYSKRNFLNEEKMSLLYGHCYRDFQYVRNSLDPERLFTNEYIKRVIGE